MRIAVDLRRIGNPGIGRYMRCLVHGIVEEGREHEYLLIAPPGSESLLPACDSRCRILPSRLRYYSVREQFALPQILRQNGIDLFHSPHFMAPLFCPCPTVITIHDVIYLACAEDLQSRVGRIYYKTMIKLAARAATAIVTDSEYSKQDIVRFLAADPEKIHVIYLAADEQFSSQTDRATAQSVRDRFGIRRDFILYAGIYKPRKNHTGLIRAFRHLLDTGLDADLVIAGGMAEGESSLRQLVSDLGIADHVIFTGFVSDEALREMYLQARVYACPSLYEGFGFTVLEAMSAGVPVVCSPETSLPEVGGTAALYADARSPIQFAGALRRVFTDGGMRTSMVESGYENVRRFSWQRTARETLAVYEKAVGLGSRSQSFTSEVVG